VVWMARTVLSDRGRRGLAALAVGLATSASYNSPVRQLFATREFCTASRWPARAALALKLILLEAS
jgi:hypothetical protein